LYTSLCHRRKTVGILRIDHGTSTFAQLTATAGLGTTLPGHEKGGIEDEIPNPNRRGRHSETLTKEEMTQEERSKYGGHEMTNLSHYLRRKKMKKVDI